jgi:hypothetical protein
LPPMGINTEARGKFHTVKLVGPMLLKGKG